MSSTEQVARVTGLTRAQVRERVRDGRTNDVPDRTGRSVGDIVRANVFTRINAILGVLFVLVLATGSIIDGMFGLLIVANSVVGIVQELRAKQTLDKLAIVGQARPIVRRDGAAQEVAPGEVVLDDVIELGPGDQIVVDGEVLECEMLEVDESLLTGEADPIGKPVGAQVMSGSFVVVGFGRLPRDQGRPRGVRRPAGRGGQQIHAGRFRAAQRHRLDPESHYLPADSGGAANDLQPAVLQPRNRGDRP